ncbi:pyridoxamine 5'-phosphate oxidase [Aggregatibacter actinomycetemcomitans]|uniref:pyridoxamine 5'-phosphate oxidase n=1 Tax=Aggregatibacter actinomycetemcomitans TaxID=714 RepID=UPI0011D9ABC4|nr:pyridoxamine 5'-phosphate oxidase [Aggregatibacter actinomycetemcomitans]TYA50758.1 pyridoxamine 5'-phosphate oxidase [Aggregatibacter actinomycetemcomitans]TYB28897.1 pyridoxamine 5'-phosphate oxidase [Aggregatibacter actinomycetemcomitans]
MDLHNIRAEYRKKVLSQRECHPNPITQFEHWLDDAINAQVNEPTAMNLATVNENGRPSSRMVLLKEVNAQGFVFFTNYHSRKGRAIEQQPYVALTFFWPELERSVRIEGKAEKISAEQSDAYFASRPYTSRIGAWASEQSAVISGYKSLLAKAALIAAQHPFNVPRPQHWGGYLVTPDHIEFWQGRPSRLHDRICYLLENWEWKNVRLSP